MTSFVDSDFVSGSDRSYTCTLNIQGSWNANYHNDPYTNIPTYNTPFASADFLVMGQLICGLTISPLGAIVSSPYLLKLGTEFPGQFQSSDNITYSFPTPPVNYSNMIYPTGVSASLTVIFNTMVFDGYPMVELNQIQSGLVNSVRLNIDNQEYYFELTQNDSQYFPYPSALSPSYINGLQYTNSHIFGSGIDIFISDSMGFTGSAGFCKSQVSAELTCPYLLIDKCDPSNASYSTSGIYDYAWEYARSKSISISADVGKYSAQYLGFSEFIQIVNPILGVSSGGGSIIDDVNNYHAFNGFPTPTTVKFQEYFNNTQISGTKFTIGYGGSPIPGATTNGSGTITLEDPVSPGAFIETIPGTEGSPDGYVVSKYPTGTGFNTSQYEILTPDIYSTVTPLPNGMTTNIYPWLRTLEVLQYTLPKTWPVTSICTSIQVTTPNINNPGMTEVLSNPFTSPTWADPNFWYRVNEESGDIFSQPSDTDLQILFTSPQNIILLSKLWYDLGPFRQFTFTASLVASSLLQSFSDAVFTVGFWTIHGIRYEWDVTLDLEPTLLTIDMFNPTRVIPVDPKLETNFATYQYPNTPQEHTTGGSNVYIEQGQFEFSNIFPIDRQLKIGCSEAQIYIIPPPISCSLSITEPTGVPIDLTGMEASFGATEHDTVYVFINSVELNPTTNHLNITTNRYAFTFYSYQAIITKIDGYIWYSGNSLFYTSKFYYDGSDYYSIPTLDILSETALTYPMLNIIFNPQAIGIGYSGEYVGSEGSLGFKFPLHSITPQNPTKNNPNPPPLLITNIFTTPLSQDVDAKISIYCGINSYYSFTASQNIELSYGDPTTAISTFIAAPGGFDIYSRTYGNPTTTLLFSYSRIGVLTGYCGKAGAGPFKSDEISATINLVTPETPVTIKIPVGSDGTYSYDSQPFYINNPASIQNKSIKTGINYKAIISYKDKFSIISDPNKYMVLPYTGYDPLNPELADPLHDTQAGYNSRYRFETPYYWLGFGMLDKANGIFISIPTYGYITVAFTTGNNIIRSITYPTATIFTGYEVRGSITDTVDSTEIISVMCFGFNYNNNNNYYGFYIAGSLTVLDIIYGNISYLTDYTKVHAISSFNSGVNWTDEELVDFPNQDIRLKQLPVFAQIALSPEGIYIELCLVAGFSIVGNYDNYFFIRTAHPSDNFPGFPPDFRMLEFYSLKPFPSGSTPGSPTDQMVTMNPGLMQPSIVFKCDSRSACYMVYSDNSNQPTIGTIISLIGSVATVLTSFNNGISWLFYNNISFPSHLDTTYDFCFTGCATNKLGKCMFALMGIDSLSFLSLGSPSNYQSTMMLYDITDDPTKAQVIYPSVQYLDGSLGPFKLANAPFGFSFDPDHHNQLFLVAIPFLGAQSTTSDFSIFLSMDGGNTFVEQQEASGVTRI